MTICTLKGVKAVNYISKKDNQPRSGFELHYEYEDDGIQGVGCGNVYLASKNVNIPDLQPGFQFYIMYNQYGRADGYLTVDKK